jgi:hypothetical protein
LDIDGSSASASPSEETTKPVVDDEKQAATMANLQAQVEASQQQLKDSQASNDEK